MYDGARGIDFDKEEEEGEEEEEVMEMKGGGILKKEVWLGQRRRRFMP